MTARRQTVLWDLDGTLTNSFLGISRSLQHVMRTLALPVPDAEGLRAYIGPPIQDTLASLIGSDDPVRVDAALQLYRRRYNDIGKLENEVIPGIPEALEAVAATGAGMFVATSKLELYSIDIVKHFSMERFFCKVYGSQLDGSRADKGDLIRFIVDTERLDPSRTVMIGDRLHDVQGARKNDMPAIGVLWGFGDRRELEEAGAAAIAETPEQLPGLIAELLARN